VNGTRWWHVNRWPPLAKAETLIKLAAFGFAYTAFAGSIGRATVPLAWDVRSLVQVAILGVLSLGLVVAVRDRWRRREVVSMVFVLINAPAHGLLLVVLLRGANVDFWLSLFATLMLLGDVIKAVSFYVPPPPARDLSPAAGTALTGIYALGYAVIFALEHV